MKKLPNNPAVGLRSVALFGFLFLLAVGLIYPQLATKKPAANTKANANAKKTAAAKPTPKKRKQIFPDFSHSKHKLECSSCHKFPSPNWKQVRPESDAFEDITDYPKHDSCLDCHQRQFFRGRPPMVCRTCHINPGPRDSSRYPFPNPREIFDKTDKGKQAVSDFEVFFPHDKHIDIVSQLGEPRENARRLRMVKASLAAQSELESCKVCHQTYRPQGDDAEEYEMKPPANWGDKFWLKKGTFKTKPIGHTVCFTCHSVDSGLSPAPTDCATCHKLQGKQPAADFDAKLAAQIGVDDKRLLDTWKRRDSSATFRHEWFSHTELACTTCHDIRNVVTTDPQTTKIKILSCGGDGTGCHITPTSDDGGILNMEIDSRKSDAKFQCVKCHLTFGKSPIPESHVQAIANFAPK